jgi:hypothetical protein
MKLKSPACDRLHDGMIVICHPANFGKIVMGIFQQFADAPNCRSVSPHHPAKLQ